MLPTDIVDNEDELQEEAPKRGSKIVLWLVICGLAIFFLPLYVISTTVKTTNERLTTELEGIQATLSATPPVDPVQQTLSAQYADAQKQSQAVGSINSTLKSSYVNWPTIMASLGAYDLNQMAVNSVSQIDNGLRITGRATREIVAMAYADMLRASGLFDTVAVESITLQSVFITVTPSTEITPTLAVTVDPRSRATVVPVPTVEIKVTDFIISVTIKKVIVNDGRST